MNAKNEGFNIFSNSYRLYKDYGGYLSILTIRHLAHTPSPVVASHKIKP